MWWNKNETNQETAKRSQTGSSWGLSPEKEGFEWILKILKDSFENLLDLLILSPIKIFRRNCCCLCLHLLTIGGLFWRCVSFIKERGLREWSLGTGEKRSDFRLSLFYNLCSFPSSFTRSSCSSPALLFKRHSLPLSSG